jgi:hypothetical protein
MPLRRIEGGRLPEQPSLGDLLDRLLGFRDDEMRQISARMELLEFVVLIHAIPSDKTIDQSLVAENCGERSVILPQHAFTSAVPGRRL